MKDWVKIIEVDGKKVLFYLETDRHRAGKQTQYCLHQVISCSDGQTADFVVGGITPENVDTVFESLAEEDARNVIAALADMLTEVTDVQEDTYD